MELDYVSSVSKSIKQLALNNYINRNQWLAVVPIMKLFCDALCYVVLEHIVFVCLLEDSSMRKR